MRFSHFVQRPYWLGALALAALVPLTSLTAQAPAEDKPADLIVRLPADATLVIGSSNTLQTGGERFFISPPLPVGKTFVYRLTATWTENGQAKSEVRDVIVRAGEKSEVDFSKPDAGTTAAAPVDKPAVPATAPKTRTFLFTYAVTLKDVPKEQTTRIWLPVPSSSEDQEVRIESSKDLPEGYKINKEEQYGNQVLYVEAKPNDEGMISLSVTYQVTRREVKSEGKVTEGDEQLARLLKPDTVVPTEGKPLELIKGKPLPNDQVAAAKVIYDAVNGHMKYSKKGTGWGRGDSNWAFENCYGNCTDFHSLFISVARAQKIPTKFEIGFPLPEKRGEGEIGGYHCWAKFKPEGKGWIPVDISEANKDPKMKDYYFGSLTEDRVTFTTGRDLELVPKQDGPPLNFFVYPYVEVDGKTYPADKTQRKFTYKDLQ